MQIGKTAQDYYAQRDGGGNMQETASDQQEKDSTSEGAQLIEVKSQKIEEGEMELTHIKGANFE